MHFFGNPNFPKKNLRSAATVLTFLSFSLGMTIERVIWHRGTRADYILLVLFIGVLFTTTKTFRLALDSLPPDPEDQALGDWVVIGIYLVIAVGFISFAWLIARS